MAYLTPAQVEQFHEEGYLIVENLFDPVQDLDPVMAEYAAVLDKLAMELYAKAALVDQEKLAMAQQQCALVDAENCLKDAFAEDVRPVIREWAVSKGLPPDPLDAFRHSGYLERITEERAERNRAGVTSYA